MPVSYRLTARTRDGRDISAVFTTDALLPSTQRDTYLLPGQGGFSCSSCRGFHFLQQGSTSMLQYNDGPSGDALSYGFPAGTFQRFGTYQSQDVGSGRGTLEVVDLVPHPVSFCSTMDQSSDRSWALGAGLTFEQRFKSKETGIPNELGIRMGNNQNPYSIHLRLSVDGAQVYDRTYSGLVQRRSDWATVFDLSGLTAAVAAGSWVTVSITPDQDVGMEPIFSQDPDVPQGEMPRYGAMAMRFYMNGMSMAAGV